MGKPNGPENEARSPPLMPWQWSPGRPKGRSASPAVSECPHEPRAQHPTEAQPQRPKPPPPADPNPGNMPPRRTPTAKTIRCRENTGGNREAHRHKGPRRPDRRQTARTPPRAHRLSGLGECTATSTGAQSPAQVHQGLLGHTVSCTSTSRVWPPPAPFTQLIWPLPQIFFISDPHFFRVMCSHRW